MGCCFSRSSGPNSPYPGGAPNASSRAINPPPLTLPDSAHPVPSSSSPASPASPRRRRHSSRPLDQHIDKPLRRHEWSSRDRPWSRRQLARERADFFDTRVTGRPEIWQTLHAALQVLWDPASQGDDGSNGLATAQSILSAAEISLPTGNLANGVYDSLGNYYPLPEYIVCDPRNVLEDSLDDKAARGDDVSTAAEDTTAEDEGLSDDEMGRKRREKGKEVVDAQYQDLSLCARLSENGRDINLQFSEIDIVKTISRKIAREAELPDTKKIRIAYMGKILKDQGTLNGQGWQRDHVVNAFVFNR